MEPGPYGDYGCHLIIDMDVPYALCRRRWTGIRRNVTEKHGHDDILEVKVLPILSKGSGNTAERQTMIAAGTGLKITINGFRTGRTVFFHMKVEIDITAQK